MSARDERDRDARLRDAYAWCERLAASHYENFPVASRLLPKAMRPHIAAIYAFARAADDFADEPGIEDAQRLHLLNVWERRLDVACSEPVRFIEVSPRPEPGADEIFFALSDTIARHRLPAQLFKDLLSAFRQDVTVRRYATWSDVLDYCRRSANPIGRLVLRVAGYDNPALDRASDAVCTALQLTNFWQDVERDWKIGRLYVPLEERERAGAREEDLDAGRVTGPWRSALRASAARTRVLFREGRPVADGVGGRLRWELRFTYLGGMRILDKLEAVDFDVVSRRPTLGAADVPALLWQAARWRTAARRPEAGS